MKKSAFILMLALTSTGVYAESPAATTTPSSAPTAAVDVKPAVRHPVGNANKFWNALDWSKLSGDEQKLWAVLGWNEKNWQNDKEKAPASENTDWDKLSQAEQAAAIALGYDKKSWDAE
jgi:hypothetical protein